MISLNWFTEFSYTLYEVEEMKNEQKKYVCALCGYTADGRLVGDICPNCGLTYWKCTKCGFLITAAKPPDVCRECGERCSFVDSTC
jgi:rubrerythrin